MLGIRLVKVTDSGLICGALLTQDYQFRPFIARHGDADPCGPDLNLDGEVGTDDLLQVLANWS